MPQLPPGMCPLPDGFAKGLYRRIAFTLYAPPDSYRDIQPAAEILRWLFGLSKEHADMLQTAAGCGLDMSTAGHGSLCVCARNRFDDAPGLAESVSTVLEQHFIYRVVLEFDEMRLLHSSIVGQLCPVERARAHQAAYCGCAESRDRTADTLPLPAANRMPYFDSRGTMMGYRPEQPRGGGKETMREPPEPKARPFFRWLDECLRVDAHDRYLIDLFGREDDKPSAGLRYLRPDLYFGGMALTGRLNRSDE